ncbi:MAG: hypothetical protein NVS4B3_15350 [Gemmatimonadaceae bacterium]
MASAFALAIALAIAVSCGGGGGAGGSGISGPPPNGCGVAGDRLAAYRAGDVIDDPRPQAARATATGSLTGVIAHAIGADGGGGFTSGVTGFSKFTVLDVFSAGSDGRPSAELFIFLPDSLIARPTPLGAVTLADLHTRGYTPTVAFALYAEQYDPAKGDYTRWLVSQSGCFTVGRVDAGGVSRAAGSLTLHGTWQTEAGATLGNGDANATLELPVLRLLTTSGRLRDSLVAAVSGARSETIVVPTGASSTTGSIQSYQELHAAAPRFVSVALAPVADSVRELWISVPRELAVDSIRLADPTLDAARAGQASVPFAMLQVNTGSTTRQLWRSSGAPSDYVRLTNVVQVGPLALCGYATGRFAYQAIGSNPQTVPATDLGTISVNGRFATVFTVLKPSDTLVATAHDMLLGRFIEQSIALVNPGTAALCQH